MKKRSEIVNVNDVAYMITRSMESKINLIKDMLDLDITEILELVEDHAKDKKEEVVNIIINEQLEILKTITMDDYKSVQRDVDEVTDYFASKKEDFEGVIEEGDYIANQILFKVIGINNRKLSLPIDISIIKEYCFSTELKEEQYFDTFIWIALRYIAIARCIAWKNIKVS